MRYSKSLPDENPNGSQQLTDLIAEKDRLERTINVTWQSVRSRELSALSANRLRDTSLTSEEEAWIRAAVRSRDQVFLDSLFIDLESVTKRIASLNAY